MKKILLEKKLQFDTSMKNLENDLAEVHNNEKKKNLPNNLNQIKNV